MSRPSIKAVAVVCVLAVLGWHVRARLEPAAELGVLDRALLTVTAPVQKGITSGFRGMGGVFEGYLALVGTKKRNAELQQELAQARAAVAELGELRAENDRLRTLAALRSRVEGETLGATVIGRGTSARYRTVRIDRGTRDGVRPDMAVLGAEGVVGHVLRAGGAYSDVLLITDGVSCVGATVQRSRARTIAAGDGDRGVELDFIRRTDLEEVVVGDLVVTTGEDGIYPEGVPVGTVVSAEPAESGLFLDAVLEPAVALDRIEEVLVVTEPGSGPWPARLIGPVVEVDEDSDLAPDDETVDPWGPPLLGDPQ